MDSAFPPSWPAREHPSSGAVPDQPAILAAAASKRLPAPDWVPLLAAMCALGPLDAKQRKTLAGHLLRHAPSAQGFEKALKPGKAWDAAAAARLDPELFATAMLFIAPAASMATVLKKRPPEVAFRARAAHRHVEHRLTSKSLPKGLGLLRELRRFVLLSPGKLQRSDHVEALAGLPRPIHLILAFDGLPDEISPAFSWFFPPDLSLLTPGGFCGLSFETTGSLIRLTLEQLSALADWKRLETLALGSTSLGQLDSAGIKELKARLPQLRKLVVHTVPEEPLSGLEVVAWNDWVKNPWGV
ncbi:MAG: hypothetical protein JNJ54_06030 [Myxococcaceae bacterium]|nr:hypothetical protein [Myxococcaceae bacterium]